ncbi:hypothetical protein FBU59_000707 [Linderina macrospora]|uniref:Uncharacterized protein n=1 Tax=Linderina macrospora TaxID=4868 RepID=A0ACC1JFX0_9FUNG|nr:hypothetical protein FBU59_000707 [Linderina macrospora]
MPSVYQALHNNKPILVGLVVTPIGLYMGMRLKEYRKSQQVAAVQREAATVDSVERKKDTGSEIRLELQDVRNARSLLRRQESQLSVELESIGTKIQRLDEMQNGK